MNRGPLDDDSVFSAIAAFFAPTVDAGYPVLDVSVYAVLVAIGNPTAALPIGHAHRQDSSLDPDNDRYAAPVSLRG